MIRTDAELQEARARLLSEHSRRADYRDQLRRSGLPETEIATALAPLEAFGSKINEEIMEYVRARGGAVPMLTQLHEFGRSLVMLRIASGITQRELASRLRVHESLISRDERNEYQGVTIQRAVQVLDALGVRAQCTFDIQPMLENDKGAA